MRLHRILSFSSFFLLLFSNSSFVFAQQASKTPLDEKRVVIVKEDGSTILQEGGYIMTKEAARRARLAREQKEKELKEKEAETAKKVTEEKTPPPPVSKPLSKKQEDLIFSPPPTTHEKVSFKTYAAFRTGSAMIRNDIEKNVWFASYAMGVSFNQTLRTELEYTYRKKTNAFVLGKNHEILIQSVMLNGYFDILSDKFITPFVGAGVGYSRLKSEVDFVKTHINRFTWSFGAGIGFRVNEDQRFDLGYRRVNFKNSGKTHTHEIYAGLMFEF